MIQYIMLENSKMKNKIIIYVFFRVQVLSFPQAMCKKKGIFPKKEVLNK